ncbi:fumarylacetoacetate hydrolase family protein [Pseudidiomarina sp. 1ASP75-14]|uniref:fumarylacetoacetate hydrolase family protein n=1 Tax=Pseudidiomarina terrestris TaxID=2820060 RepID=UPI002653D057|nr:fumarylacetoacetate hydrolase family protein [Pseudidiomarina sp. 1ASP75-14]MDN7137565.1 fumarylacetoacetate hydrolase family protein [Pseudidiomarina sp. 1ASP75-14]
MLKPSKIVCVGRNYAAHAAELNNPIPAEPLLFIKPPSSLAKLPEVRIPTDRGACHHELELAVQVQQRLRRATPEQASAAIGQVTLALDLTLRELQDKLKQQGQPWERAKAFDGACVLAEWLVVDDPAQLQQASFKLFCDEHLQQQGEATQMLMPIAELIAHISHTFTLEPGDVVLTGTPAGVGPLHVGQQLDLHLQFGAMRGHWQGKVIADE